MHKNPLGQAIGDPLPHWQPPSAPAGDTLLGRYCRLERLDPHIHASDLYAANAKDVEGRMWTYLAYGPFDTVESYRSWLEGMSRQTDPLCYAIINLATEKAVGLASLLRMDPTNGSIEVGHVAYSPLLQQTTAATEAMFLLMELAFSIGYRRYEWKCHALNNASRAAAKRLGFTFEGTFRQAAVSKGRNRDTAWFSIIDKDWPALRDAYRRWLDAANFDSNGQQILKLSDLTSRALLPAQ